MIKTYLEDIVEERDHQKASEDEGRQTWKSIRRRISDEPLTLIQMPAITRDGFQFFHVHHNISKKKKIIEWF